MNWPSVGRAGLGTALTLLGILWSLQGADVVRIQPILCFANCEPITGGSLLWLALGVGALIGGLWILDGLRRRRRRTIP